MAEVQAEELQHECFHPRRLFRNTCRAELHGGKTDEQDLQQPFEGPKGNVHVCHSAERHVLADGGVQLGHRNGAGLLLRSKIAGYRRDYSRLLVAFTTYIAMFWNPIMNLSNFYNQLITNIAGAERIFEILDIEPDITDETEAVEMPPIKGDVRFNKITFSYDEKVEVLKDLSFHVKEGETIALVGPTGAGKTTIVNLISRFYDISEGIVMIDNRDITSVSIESLRSQMGIMTQDTFLFSGTIGDNIRYGKLDATDAEVVEAAEAVHAHEFIMGFEDGYDTKINERGAKLSVGQRQLIAFARTMISKPRILILDEATSSIDTRTERLVQQGIESLLQGRTSFVIAHRLSTIQKADRIMVVDQQGITESGSHKELMQHQGHYYDLYMAQFKTADVEIDTAG